MTNFQLAFLIFELIISLVVCWTITSMTMSMWHGAPYVSTTDKSMDALFHTLALKPGTKFLELGCGNGKMVCSAVKRYGVQGRGVEISWLWILFAKLRAWRMGVADKVEILHQNILTANLAWADVIYIFMLPRFMGKYSNQLSNLMRPGTMVVSHLFKIDTSSDTSLQQISEVASGGYVSYIYRKF